MDKKPKNDLLYRFLAAGLIALGFVIAVALAVRGKMTVDWPFKSIGSQTVDLSRMIWEKADTEEERRKGLGGREALAENSGMIFEFDAPGYYPFWMKDMEFPIDIIWLLDGRVVDIATLEPPAEGATPSTRLPKGLADKVLEIKAGKAAELGIVIGTEIMLE